MIDRTLSHFRILEKVGEGGMGVVYRARDENLHREVALKVLPTGALSNEAARRRFRKEALALSRLNHPNIETVHAFETQDGADFLVMEFIPGVTLDEKLATGPLAETDVARLGAQLAEGLAAAHDQGVVHRDLKPANLRLTPDGRLKVLDFGLAKWLESGADPATTGQLDGSDAGGGTLPYMAPEQLRQEGVDPRSDIYAAGAVLFQMATARRPFPQTSPARLIEAILSQAPPRPGALNPLISPALESVILKALDKDPGRRYQTAREMHVDLVRLKEASWPGPETRWRRPWRAAAVALALGGALIGLALLAALDVGGWRRSLEGALLRPKASSIAVLPLTNLSGDPEQEYFADGMTDELITNLAQISGLRVISRTSVMRYKDARRPLPEIARELSVGTVVEGTVRRSGSHVRIAAQLIEAATDRHLWARTYERDLKDVMMLQAEVAQAIAREIRVNLTPQEAARLAEARPINPEAHEAYLKARYLTVHAEHEKAIDYLERAIALEPEYAQAHAYLSIAYSNLARYNMAPPRDVYPKAREIAQRAIELDDGLADAHRALARILKNFDWDWERSGREYRRAVELDPGDWHEHAEYAEWLDSTGRPDEALVEYQKARDLEPSLPELTGWVADHYRQARQYDRALDLYRLNLEQTPDDNDTRGNIGLCLAYQGRFQEAIAESRLAVEKELDSTGLRLNLARVYALAGMREEAEKALDDVLLRAEHERVSPVGIALVRSALGQKDLAFASLDRAVDERMGGLVALDGYPELDPLRPDPRFAELRGRLGLPAD